MADQQVEALEAQCTRCKQTKLLAEFKQGKTKRNKQCITCLNRVNTIRNNPVRPPLDAEKTYYKCARCNSMKEEERYALKKNGTRRTRDKAYGT